MVVAMSAAPALGLGERVHIGKAILDERVRRGLRHVAGEARVPPGRDAAERVAVAVLVMRDADHRRLALLGELARMTGQALVRVEVERVSLNRMWDERRLVGVVPFAAHVVRDLTLHRRSRYFPREWFRPLQPRGIKSGAANLLC